MNYHQGLKTELEARMPELMACQELGRSLLLNKSAMADEVGEKHGVPLSAPTSCLPRCHSHPTHTLPDPGAAGQAGNQEGGGV